MSTNLTQLPNYICRQEIDRMVRRGGPPAMFLPADQVRVEVAFVGGQELYARSGHRRFDTARIEDVVPGGAVANGSFALHAKILFQSDEPEFQFAGETRLQHRRAYRFDFKVPLTTSEYLVRSNGSARLVPYHGSVWADAGTLEVLRLQVEITELPRNLNLAHVLQTIDYKRVHIGNSDFLLPQKSEMLCEDLFGNVTRNTTRFDRCQQFVGDSIVSYESAVPGE